VNKCLRCTFHCATEKGRILKEVVIFYSNISTAVFRKMSQDRQGQKRGEKSLANPFAWPSKQTSTSPLRTACRTYSSSIIVLKRRHRLRSRLPRAQQIDRTDRKGNGMKRNLARYLSPKLIFWKSQILISARRSYNDFGVRGFLIIPPYWDITCKETQAGDKFSRRKTILIKK
jgi:hypothetical protein